MTLATWGSFVLASAIMGLIPGPGVASIVGYALGSGRRTALASVAGIALGNALAMSISLLGAGAVLAASALAFSFLKWTGALYLIGLGLYTLATRAPAAQASADALSPRTAFWGNFAVGALHPKTIVFYVAFVPQFISGAEPYAPQAAMLTATFCLVVAATDTAYALAASAARGWLAKSETGRWGRRASGAVLIGAGVATAAARS